MRKRYLFYTLLFISAIIDAVAALFDSYLLNNVTTDPFVYTSALFMAGFVVCCVLGIFFSTGIRGRSIGSLIDPAFRRIRIFKKAELPYHLIAGIGNAITTIAYAALFSYYTDPSSILPFYQVVILYLLLIEAASEKNAPTIAEAGAGISVVFGAIMMSMTNGIGDFRALLIVFLVLNPAYAILTIYQRKLKSMTFKGTQNDAINIRFWNVFFSMLFALLLSLVIRPSSTAISFYALSDYFSVFITLTTLATFSYILFIRALGISTASIAQAVKSVSLIISIVFSLLMGQMAGIESTFALLKIMGVILVILGIVDISFTEVRAFLFIRVKNGHSAKEVTDAIWKIKGIDSVSSVSGEYDVIARVRTRTLGKGYETIVTKINAIDGIRDFHWDSVLKEWENV
jgi:DNA-binding Lrp family transcriptional regulator